MSRMIFVNLPVKDLTASRAVFTALGFAFNDECTDDRAATEVLSCITAGSRGEVDALVRRAVEAGGKPWKDSFAEGPMYGGSFQDLDGHVWEVMHMDDAEARAH